MLFGPEHSAGGRTTEIVMLNYSAGLWMRTEFLNLPSERQDGAVQRSSNTHGECQ